MISIVDATIIAAPSSIRNAEGERDPEMHQTKEGNQLHFGIKVHIAVDAHMGLVHTVTTRQRTSPMSSISSASRLLKYRAIQPTSACS